MAVLPIAPVLLSQRDADEYRRASVGWDGVATVSKTDAWDDGGTAVGIEAARAGKTWLDRPYATGLPPERNFAARCDAVARLGGVAQVGNEPQLPEEHVPGATGHERALTMARWARRVRDLSNAPRGSLLWTPLAIADDWRAILHDPEWIAGAREFGAAAVHVYGSAAECVDVIEAHRAAYGPGVDLWVTECNPAAGRTFDWSAWARADLPIIANACVRLGVRFLALFAWKWDQSPKLPTSLDVCDQPAVLDALRRTYHVPEPQPAPEVKPVELPGIDVSNHQGAVDWPAVVASGERFAFIKASEDWESVAVGYRDPWFARNWAGARDAGLIRGAYHFARPSRTSPALSVTLFQECIAAVGGLQPGDLIALDIEDEQVERGRDLAVWCAEWCDLATRVFGVAPVVYTGGWYATPHGLTGGALSGYPLWLALYDETERPAPLAGWSEVSIWQWTAHGSVPGVVGDCDRNTFYGDAAALRALGLPDAAAPEPAPAEPDAITQALDALWSDTEDHARAGNIVLAEALQRQIDVLKDALGR